MAEDIFLEGFEQWGIPQEWQVWEVNEPYSYTWWVYYDHYWGFGHDNSHGFAIRWGDNYLIDSWLVLPTLDMSGYDNLTFSCWYCGASQEEYSGTYIMGTDIVYPDTGDFVELHEFGPPNDHPHWSLHTVGASLFADEPNVTFAIRYTGLDGHGVYLDDVLITDDFTNVESASLGEIKAIYR
jgi:hypothetical protein